MYDIDIRCKQTPKSRNISNHFLILATVCNGCFPPIWYEYLMLRNPLRLPMFPISHFSFPKNSTKVIFILYHAILHIWMEIELSHLGGKESERS